MSDTLSDGNATFIVVEPAVGISDTGVLLDIVFAGLPALAVSLESCTFANKYIFVYFHGIKPFANTHVRVHMNS